MKEILLFGAGASYSADVPMALAMTARMLELAASSQPRKTSRVLSYVVGGLLFGKANQGENPLTTGVNVEELFNAVDLLGKRHSLEASPFVGSWHAMVDELDRLERTSFTVDQAQDRVHAAMYASVSEAIIKALEKRPTWGKSRLTDQMNDWLRQGLSNRTTRGAGEAITVFVDELSKVWGTALKDARPRSADFKRHLKEATKAPSSRAEGQVFQRVTEWMITQLRTLVWIPSDAGKRIEYLAPLLNLVERQPGLTVASLNYDNVVERLSELGGIACNRGLESWQQNGTIGIHESGLNLLKLHGSIDWVSRSTDHASGLHHSIVVEVNESEMQKQKFRPAVIFGQRNKLTAKGPFLDLLQTFRAQLETSDVLTVVGYSFADDHVNEIISRWFSGGATRRIRVIDPKIRESKSPFVKRLVAYKDTRVDFLVVGAAEALKEIYGTRTLGASPLTAGISSVT